MSLTLLTLLPSHPQPLWTKCLLIILPLRHVSIQIGIRMDKLIVLFEEFSLAFLHPRPEPQKYFVIGGIKSR
jgi:hypothetical protein